MQRVALGQRDHLIDDRLDGLRFRNGGDNPFLVDHAGHQVLEQRIAGAYVALEFCSSNTVSHSKRCPPSSESNSDISGTEPGGGGGGATRRPCASGFMPSARPMVPRISLISLRDFRPKFLVRSISDSDF